MRSVLLFFTCILLFVACRLPRDTRPVKVVKTKKSCPDEMGTVARFITGASSNYLGSGDHRPGPPSLDRFAKSVTQVPPSILESHLHDQDPSKISSEGTASTKATGETKGGASETEENEALRRELAKNREELEKIKKMISEGHAAHKERHYSMTHLIGGITLLASSVFIWRATFAKSISANWAAFRGDWDSAARLAAESGDMSFHYYAKAQSYLDENGHVKNVDGFKKFMESSGSYMTYAKGRGNQIHHDLLNWRYAVARTFRESQIRALSEKMENGLKGALGGLGMKARSDQLSRAFASLTSERRQLLIQSLFNDLLESWSHHNRLSGDATELFSSPYAQRNSQSMRPADAADARLERARVEIRMEESFRDFVKVVQTVGIGESPVQFDPKLLGASANRPVETWDRARLIGEVHSSFLQQKRLAASDLKEAADLSPTNTIKDLEKKAKMMVEAAFAYRPGQPPVVSQSVEGETKIFIQDVSRPDLTSGKPVISAHYLESAKSFADAADVYFKAAKIEADWNKKLRLIDQARGMNAAMNGTLQSALTNLYRQGPNNKGYRALLNEALDLVHSSNKTNIQKFDGLAQGLSPQKQAQIWSQCYDMMTFSSIGKRDGTLSSLLENRFSGIDRTEEFDVSFRDLQAQVRRAITKHQQAVGSLSSLETRSRPFDAFAGSVRAGQGSPIKVLKRPDFARLSRDLPPGEASTVKFIEARTAGGQTSTRIQGPTWEIAYPGALHVPYTGSAGVALNPLSSKRYFASKARYVPALAAVTATAVFGAIGVASGLGAIFLAGGQKALKAEREAKFRRDISDFHQKWSCVKQSGDRCQQARRCLNPS